MFQYGILWKISYLIQEGKRDMDRNRKRFMRALKYMIVFTVVPHLIFIAMNMAINIFYGMPVTEGIFSLYTPRRAIIFCIVTCIVFLEYYFFITDKSDEK